MTTKVRIGPAGPANQDFDINADCYLAILTVDLEGLEVPPMLSEKTRRKGP